LARLFFMAFEAAGQTPVVKRLRQAGHRLAHTEPKYPAFYDLLKQQAPPPDAFVVDCSLKAHHALESCNYVRSLKAYKTTPIVLYNVKKDDEAKARDRVAGAILLPDDKVEKTLAGLGFAAASSPPPPP
jgi:hypothetical protein